MQDLDPKALFVRVRAAILAATSRQQAMLRDGTVARALETATRYAQGAPLAAVEVTAQLEVLRQLVLETATPELVLVQSAVEARLALDRGDDLTAVELAVLAGISRDHILDLARSGSIPSAYRAEQDKRQPWRFRSTKALKKWIADRNA